MHTGTDTLTKIIKLLVSAVNDPENVLGQGSLLDKFAASGRLLPQLVDILMNIGKLPSEVRDLDTKEIQASLSQVAEIDLPGEKADEFKEAGLAAYTAFVDTLGHLEKTGNILAESKAEG